MFPFASLIGSTCFAVLKFPGFFVKVNPLQNENLEHFVFVWIQNVLVPVKKKLFCLYYLSVLAYKIINGTIQLISPTWVALKNTTNFAFITYHENMAIIIHTICNVSLVICLSWLVYKDTAHPIKVFIAINYQVTNKSINVINFLMHHFKTSHLSCSYSISHK